VTTPRGAARLDGDLTQCDGRRAHTRTFTTAPAKEIFHARVSEVHGNFLSEFRHLLFVHRSLSTGRRHNNNDLPKVTQPQPQRKNVCRIWVGYVQ
jgi:hypothetical protein